MQEQMLIKFLLMVDTEVEWEMSRSFQVWHLWVYVDFRLWSSVNDRSQTQMVLEEDQTVEIEAEWRRNFEERYE